jgi:hypothetical protein
MASQTPVHAVAQALLKRATTNEVDWSKEEADYFVRLGDVFFRLSRKGESTQSEPDIVFEVDTTEGKRIGVIQAKFGEPEYNDLHELLKNAESYTSNWDRMLLDVAKQIEQSPGRVGGADFEGPLTPPAPPQRPTRAQAQRLFETIAGTWDLLYQKGGKMLPEKLRIDETGNYFVQIGEHGQGVGSANLPKYRLALVSCDPGLRHVEISKQELNGKVKQIEVLTISPTAMEGYAKHDEHKLFYRRKP